jgi:hypothetical protein
MKIGRRMRRAALAMTAFACVAFAHADERILSFDSTITVAHDGTLEVRETIRVNAEGDAIRRGIYRDFPTIYPGKDGRQIVVGFAFQGAARDGIPEPWRTEPRGNGIRIYLGNPQAMLPHGEHVYDIVYRTDRQMGFFADHDELYWNVTGNGWGFEIDKVTARVILPPDIPPADVRMEAYTGPQGARGRDYSAVLRDGVPTYGTTKRLDPREGLTIVAMWPKGYITAAVENPLPPSPIASADYAAAPGAPVYGSPAEALLGRNLPRDRRPLWFAVIGFILLILYYYVVWNARGRDPPGKVTIPLYESPAGQTPASMRYLMRMSYDDKCFAAAVLSLAVKGYLRIEQESGILGFGKTFTLQRSVAPAGSMPALSDDEQSLLAGIFASGDRIELKQENYRDIRDARSAHRSSLRSRFTSNFFRINGGWHALGIVFSILVAVLSLSQPGQGEWPSWFLASGGGLLTLLFVLLGIVANGVFGKLLKAPTIAGQAVMDRIRGFKMYLEVAERDDLQRIDRPPLTPRLFESYLPAALALGVEQAWAERFAEVFRMQAPNYQPAWYAGSGWNVGNIAGFSSQLGSSLGNAISSSATAPGSSSGGGGGGSSGGGGGGGGGGGW